MKKIAMSLVCLSFVFVLIVSPVSAASYEYIIDNNSLFDDSTDMISMAKEIRNKLDFDIHIYSVSTLDETEEIIDQYMQISSVLLIFVSEEGEMTWYSGSSVQQTIRDIDFENLFSNVSISRKQYTKAVNFILSKILSIYVYGDETIDNYATTSDYHDIDSEQSWFLMNLRYYITFIQKHPVRILLIIVCLFFSVLYLYKRNQRLSENDDDKND